MAAVTALLDLLDLRQIDDADFEGRASHERHVRAFGGQVAAQALVAAGRTVESARPVNSLHVYFLRPGQPSEPILYRVARLRDGRSFTTRLVEGIQDDRVIFQMSASFHINESGVAHSESMPAAPSPNELRTFEDRFAGRDESDMERWFSRVEPFDIRYVNTTPFDPPAGEHPSRQQVWIKTKAGLSDDTLLHRCITAYASDLTLLDAVLLKHGMQWTDRSMMGASLDHAMWFHQPFRVDEWLLFDQASPIATGGRGLASAEVWTEDGRLVVSIVQEALLRPPGAGRREAPTT